MAGKNVGAFRHHKDISALTPREAEVLQMFRHKIKKKDIAISLGIAVNTVNSLLTKALEKEKYK